MRIDVDVLGELIGVEPPDWNGRCHEISDALVGVDAFKGVTVFGHYRGKIHPASRWARYRHIGFVQHGWIFMPDDRVIDVVRWGFTCEEPYVFSCKPGSPEYAEYDEGGNVWRAQQTKPLPKPDGEVKDIFAELLKSGSFEAMQVVENLLLSSTPTRVNQLFWLANLPYDHFCGYSRPVYRALEALDLKSFVPIDNWRKAARSERAA